MKKIILLISLLGILHAEENVAKVVFDLTAGNLKTFERKVLKGIPLFKAHYEGNLKELHVAVMIHGGAYKFFVKDPAHSPYSGEKDLVEAYATLKKRVAAMADTYEVDFMMCESGLLKQKVKVTDVYDFVRMVPNAAIGLIDKQNEGFAYMPMKD